MMTVILPSQAIDIYTDMGRFTIAAKHHETIAGIFESEVHSKTVFSPLSFDLCPLTSDL